MAPNQEELMVAAVVVGIVALVVYNQSSTAVKLQDPDLDTKQEADERAGHKARAEEAIGATVGQMRGWSYKAKAFLEDSGASPEGEDHTDSQWVQMGALLGAARNLLGRLDQNCREYNEGVWVADRWARRHPEDEEPRIFQDFLERLEQRSHAWADYFRGIQKKKKEAAPKPDHPLAADVAPPAKKVMDVPVNELAKRILDAGDTLMISAPALPGEPQAPAKPTEPMDGFVVPSAKATQNDDAMEVSNEVAGQDPSTVPAFKPVSPEEARVAVYKSQEDAVAAMAEEALMNARVVDKRNNENRAGIPRQPGMPEAGAAPYARPMFPEDAVSVQRKDGRIRAISDKAFGPAKKAGAKIEKRPGADQPPVEFRQAVPGRPGGIAVADPIPKPARKQVKVKPKRKRTPGTEEEPMDLTEDIPDVPAIGGNTVAIRVDTVQAPAKRAETSYQGGAKRAKGPLGQPVILSAAEQFEKTQLDAVERAKAKVNPLITSDIVDQKRLMAAPGKSAPKPKQSALVPFKRTMEVAAVEMRINTLYERSSTTIEDCLQQATDLAEDVDGKTFI